MGVISCRMFEPNVETLYKSFPVGGYKELVSITDDLFWIPLHTHNPVSSQVSKVFGVVGFFKE